MSRLKVLVFIDWYLPGYKAGGPVRSLANMVDRLRDRIDFYIVTSDTEYTETDPYPNIVPDRWTELNGGEQVWYASKDGISKEAWRKLITEKRWSAVYVNGMYSRQFTIMPLWLLRNSDVRKVIAVRGMLASGPMQHGGMKKRLFLTMGRTLGLFTNVHFQATNEEEAADVQHWIGADSSVRVVPNLAKKLQVANPATREKKPGEVLLISVARIAMEKNTLLALEALMHVSDKVRFRLFGPIYDDAYWADCKLVIERLPQNITVEYLGTLPPTEVQSELEQDHGLFMPSEGENFGHTMLEALCAGTPLIISDRTPWKELEKQRAGWDVPVHEKTAANLLADRVSELAAMDQEQFDELSAGAFNMGKRYLGDPTPEEQTLKMFLA